MKTRKELAAQVIQLKAQLDVHSHVTRKAMTERVVTLSVAHEAMKVELAAVRAELAAATAKVAAILAEAQVAKQATPTE